MSSQPRDYLASMEECVLGLMEGTSGPLNAEQKILVQIVHDNMCHVPGLLELLQNFPASELSAETAMALLQDLHSLLWPIRSYTELIGGGVAGPLTPTQVQATRLILKQVQNIEVWANSFCATTSV